MQSFPKKISRVRREKIVARVKTWLSRLMPNELEAILKAVQAAVKRAKEEAAEATPAGGGVLALDRRPSVTYLCEKIRCGKAGCKCERGELHGPYWYGYYRSPQGGRVVKKYIGKVKREITPRVGKPLKKRSRPKKLVESNLPLVPNPVPKKREEVEKKTAQKIEASAGVTALPVIPPGKRNTLEDPGWVRPAIQYWVARLQTPKEKRNGKESDQEIRHTLKQLLVAYRHFEKAGYYAGLPPLNLSELEKWI